MAIGAKEIVNIIPGVVDSGGNPLDLNALFLTSSSTVAAGGVTSWNSYESVSNYFGSTSDEAAMAEIYFLGYINSNTKPSTLYFGQFVSAAVAGWLRGAEVTATIAELQTITTGTLTISIDGTQYAVTGIDFSGDSSYSAMATTLQGDLILAGADAGVTVTYESDFKAFLITSATTGASSSVSYGTAGTTVADALLLTQDLGALQSPGLAIRTIEENMNAYTEATTNWVSFMHVFDQTDDQVIEFAEWANSKNAGVRYVYSTWEDSATAKSSTDTSSIAYRVNNLNLSGTISNYDNKNLAAFACAFIASLDYEATNGRATAAFKRQGGLDITVTNETDANNLLDNGYNFYGDYQTANDSFRWYYNGQISGDYNFIDTHVNAIQLNNAFQLAFMTLFASISAIPYNQRGYDIIRAAGLDPINAALNFGTIQIGVALSEAQAAQVDNEAGQTISDILETRGWFLQIQDASAQTRGNRETPPMTFWYTDGGSVQKIEMKSNVIL